MIKGFDPIIAAQPRVLIVGSMPSVSSLDKQEYYGFKHNRFWKIISAYFNVEFSTYEQKTKCINEHQIILWDVISHCDRIGSLDSAIKNEVCNDIEGLLAKYPSVKFVICNGKKSHALFKKHVYDCTLHVLALPSTSNANRGITEELLFQTWHSAFDQVYMEKEK